MRLLHLHWSHLPLRLARARHETRSGSGSFPTGPLVLGGNPWEDGTVLDMSPEAAEMGVRRGMPLGSAHRLVPEATFLAPALDDDRAAAEIAFERLAALSPGIAGTSDPADPAFGVLEVQLDGLERLWGDERRILERAAGLLEAVLPGSPRAGAGGTRFAAGVAVALAAPGDLRSVPPARDAGFLAPLPAKLLTQDRDVRARLARLGLRRIGAIAALSRSALVARFGEAGVRLHMRSRGEETDPFRPRRSLQPLALALPVEPPVADLEPLRFVLHRLVGALSDQLLARGAAASRAALRLELELAFARPDSPAEVIVEQRLPEPTAEAEAVERLLVARLERDPPPAAVSRIELELAGVVPAAGHQLSLFVPQADRSSRLAWQLARLALTFGPDRVRAVEIADAEAVLPEARWRWRPAAEGPGSADARAGGQERAR